MTPERFHQIEQVFEAAADASPEERGAVIERLCRDDAALRAEVEALLAASPVASPRIRNAIGRAAGEVRATGEVADAPGGGLRRGARIGDRFTIDRFAQIGGMGEVYRAIDELTGAPVAIKLLRKDRNTDGRRFEREAQLLAGVDHPHVVRHVAHGSLASGERYLAMEWLEGETLDELLVLFECLAGAPAFEEAHPVAVMTRMVVGELPRLRARACGLPEPLVDLVNRMLARAPTLRPSGGAEVARALRVLVPVAEAARGADVGLPAGRVRSARADSATMPAAMGGTTHGWCRGMTTTGLAAC